MNHIAMKQLEKQLGEINLIDVRESSEYGMGHIPYAKNIPMNQLIQAPRHYLNKEEEYYLVCQSGGRSEMTCMVLDAQGYNVVNVMGGTSAYEGHLE